MILLRLPSAFALLVLVVASLLRPLAAAPARQPNFLFLFADDQALETIRAFGQTDIETPNLDRLAARGTAFTQAANMGSWTPAVCVASRTMLVTGRSLWDAESMHKTTDAERVAGRLWPQLLAAAGYRTYFTGKWHIQAKVEAAFDVARHVRPGMPKDVPAGYNRPAPGVPDPWSPSDPKFGGFWEGGRHWSEVGADDAIDFLREARGAARPFFMYVAFNAPHDPRQAPADYVARYPTSRIALPKNYLPEYPHNVAMGADRNLRDEKLGPFPRTEEAVKVHRREYYALITHLDTQIGRILDALDSSGQADNTWIFFTADHGLAVGHHGLFGKQNMYEHSRRVPFLVVGPGVPANRRIDAPVYLQDVMPTTLELAGAKKPAHVFFQSLVPLLQGKTNVSAYPAAYGAYLDRQRAVVHEGWKLILYPKTGVARLFHLAADPEEMNDLAARPEHAAVRSRLFRQLLALQQQLGDRLDLRGAYPQL